MSAAALFLVSYLFHFEHGQSPKTLPPAPHFRLRAGGAAGRGTASAPAAWGGGATGAASATVTAREGTAAAAGRGEATGGPTLARGGGGPTCPHSRRSWAAAAMATHWPVLLLPPAPAGTGALSLRLRASASPSGGCSPPAGGGGEPNGAAGVGVGRRWRRQPLLLSLSFFPLNCVDAPPPPPLLENEEAQMLRAMKGMRPKPASPRMNSPTDSGRSIPSGRNMD